MFSKDKEEKDYYTSKNCNSLLLSNSIILIPIVYAMIEALNRLPSVRTLVLIFGLVLIGCVLVSNFLAMFTIQLEDKNSRRNLMFVSYLLSSSIYLLLFIFIMVIMIVL